MVCLIKPQFEAGREKVGKKGVVRDPQVHLEVIRMVADFARVSGFDLLNLSFLLLRGLREILNIFFIYGKMGQEPERREKTFWNRFGISGQGSARELD